VTKLGRPPSCRGELRGLLFERWYRRQVKARAAPVNVSLDAADAMELTQLLDLLRDWLSAGHAQLSASLERFIGSPASNVETLRADLASFAFLLGGNDGEHFTTPE
jgi:hypothetical protein